MLNKGLFYLALGTFFYGTYGVFSRKLGFNLGVFYMASVRGAMILFFLLFYLLLKRKWKKIEKKDYKWFFLMSFPGVFSFVFLFMSFNNLTLGTTMLIFYASSTIGGYLLGRVAFGEILSKIKIISLLICLFGLSLIFPAFLSTDKILYLFLPFLAGFCTSSWNIFSKKVSKNYSVMQVYTVDSIVGFLVSFLFFLIFREKIIFPISPNLGLIILLFSLATIGACVFTILGFRNLQAQIGSLVMLNEVIFASLFGFLFFSETLTLSFIIGGLLVLFGISLSNLLYLRNK